jgi:hypothetical protein
MSHGFSKRKVMMGVALGLIVIALVVDVFEWPHSSQQLALIATQLLIRTRAPVSASATYRR